MDGLRLALIIFGIVVVAVVYLWTARRRRLDREAGNFDRFDAWTDEGLDPLAPSAANHSARAGHVDTRAGPDGGLAAAERAAEDDSTEPNLRLSEIQHALKEASETRAIGNQEVADHAPGDRDAPVARGQVRSRGPERNSKGEPSRVAAAARGDGAAPQAGLTSDRHRGGRFSRDAPATAEKNPLDEGAVIDDLEAIADSLAGSSDGRSEPRIGSLDDIQLRETTSGQRIGAPSNGAPSSVDEPRQASQLGAGAQRSDNRSAGRDDNAQQNSNGTDNDEPHASAEMVVVLNVMARGDKAFDGPSLKAALEGAGLRPGDMELYHYRAETQADNTPPIFSALNTVRPGTLNVNEFEGMNTPGIALVLRMPGLERPSESFELMLVAARRMAEELNGQVCDESRSTLTKQALNHLRERIAAVAFRARTGP